MSISIQVQHRSRRRRHLAAEGFEQASLAILSRYKRLATDADASTADLSSLATPRGAGQEQFSPQRPRTAGDR